MNPGIMWYLLLHLKGRKYFTVSVISTDYKIVCSVYLTIPHSCFHLKAQPVINGLTTLYSFSVPRHYWCKLLFNSR